MQSVAKGLARRAGRGALGRRGKRCELQQYRTLPPTLTCKAGTLPLLDYGCMITQPPSSKHSAALAAWLVQRVQGMRQVILGYPKPRSVLVTFPLPDPHAGAFSATRQVLSFVAAVKVAQSFQLAVFEMGMPAVPGDMTAIQGRLDSDCLKIPCSPGSKYQPLQATASKRRLLCQCRPITAAGRGLSQGLGETLCGLVAGSKAKPADISTFALLMPQGFTQLTSLYRLTALSFLALPSGFSSLQRLRQLYLAPSDATPYDLSMHAQLTQLHIGTRYGGPLPLKLPAGPNVSLRSLILHRECRLENLGDCTELRDLDIIPGLGLHLAWTGPFPTSLPHLTQLIVDDPAELHGGMELWGHLPDEWQNYTALRKLCIPDLALDMLPEWLTTLSELRVLEMPGLSFNDNPYFPSLLQHMPKLEVLNMECIDIYIVEEVVCLAQIPNLVSLTFGCIGTNLNDDHPAQPLALAEIRNFQQLDAALEAHPNKLTQTPASLSSDQIWNFLSFKGQDPVFSTIQSLVSPHLRAAFMH